MHRGKCWKLVVDRLWNGIAADAGERAEVRLELTGQGLAVEVTAPFHDDPPPEHKPGGPIDGLWNFEVVELFAANGRGEYLELEFGPHGHWLALLFSGVRTLARRDFAISCRTVKCGMNWQAEALVPLAFLPEGIDRVNAYAIHGQGDARRYLAAYPLPGPHPDFHQPRFFRLLADIPTVLKTPVKPSCQEAGNLSHGESGDHEIKKSDHPVDE